MYGFGMKRLWDISPTISAEALLFPGDAPYRIEWKSRFSDGSPVSLCSISLSPHIGAHADAPMHYAQGAPSVADLELGPFFGPCRVIHAIGVAPLILPEHLGRQATHLPGRVLIRSRAAAMKSWSHDFAAVAPETIDWLHRQGVVLLGVDTPSVDPADSVALPGHNRLHGYDMRVLENLVLDDVAEGDYELVALPLKLAGACASPVRAVLRRL